MSRRSSIPLLLLLLCFVLSFHTPQCSAIVLTADGDAGEDLAFDADEDMDLSGDDEDMTLEDDEFDEDDDMDDEEEDLPESESADPNKPAVIDPEGEENATGYTAPSAPGAYFYDDFQSGMSKWIKTSAADYNGDFAVGQGAKPTFKGDRGMIIPEKAKKYGISTKIAGLETMEGKDVVFQYEVKLEQGMTCGGAYFKMPTGDFTPSGFEGSTTYSVMFGPDKCGATDKVHFIFQSKNPVTGKMTEHHLKEPPSVANTYDKKTHLYTLIVKADGKFEVLVDNESKKEGTLADSFEPPVQPPKEIDDAEDKKPEDWVDEAKIPDPKATKPEDWDEDAPKRIDDKDAEKPEGWLDDEPTEIPDPEVKMPEEWDTEEDGDWEAPLVPNPKCEDVGCGEWKRPTKENPDYKGKWSAPLIDNPKYVGEWKPRKIANPEYYEVTKPTLLPITGLGIEIWTMDQGVLFDNVYLGSDVAAAKAFTDGTFILKQKTELEREEEANKKAAAKEKKKGSKKTDSKFPFMEKLEDFIDLLDSKLEPLQDKLVELGAEEYLDMLINAGVQRPMLIVVSFPLIVVFLFLVILGGGGKKAPTPTESEADTVATKKKTDAPTADVSPDDAVENVDDTSVADAEQEKSGVRRRRAAKAE